VPEAYSPISNTAVVIRTNSGRGPVFQQVRAVMHQLDPELPIYSVKTLDAVISERAWPFRFFTYLLAAFAMIALLLAAVGLSGIMAQVVIERRHEIGVRMALGATARNVVAMILSRGMALVTLGAGIGLSASILTARLLEAELFGVRPNDEKTILSVVVALAATALIATWLPARRAARVDPAIALRWD